MSVHSIGVDIAEIERIRDIIDRHGDRFVKRVFTPHEIEYCSRKATYAQSYAARFAAKEAIFKAAGTGLNLGMNWKDIEVVNDELGRPSVRLFGVTAKMLEGKRVHLSLSHAGNIATALVVVDEM